MEEKIEEKARKQGRKSLGKWVPIPPTSVASHQVRVPPLPDKKCWTHVQDLSPLSTLLYPKQPSETSWKAPVFIWQIFKNLRQSHVSETESGSNWTLHSNSIPQKWQTTIIFHSVTPSSNFLVCTQSNYMVCTSIFKILCSWFVHKISLA